MCKLSRIRRCCVCWFCRKTEHKELYIRNWCSVLLLSVVKYFNYLFLTSGLLGRWIDCVLLLSNWIGYSPTFRAMYSERWCFHVYMSSRILYIYFSVVYLKLSMILLVKEEILINMFTQNLLRNSEWIVWLLNYILCCAVLMQVECGSFFSWHSKINDVSLLLLSLSYLFRLTLTMGYVTWGLSFIVKTGKTGFEFEKKECGFSRTLKREFPEPPEAVPETSFCWKFCELVMILVVRDLVFCGWRKNFVIAWVE